MPFWGASECCEEFFSGIEMILQMSEVTMMEFFVFCFNISSLNCTCTVVDVKANVSFLQPSEIKAVNPEWRNCRARETLPSSDADALLSAACRSFIFWGGFRARLLSGTCLMHKVKKDSDGMSVAWLVSNWTNKILYLSGFFYRIYFKI